MTPMQVIAELAATHEFVLEYIQEAEEDNRMWQIRFEDVLQEARQEFGYIAPPISDCIKGWVVLEIDKR